MLVLTRREGEALLIGDDIRIVVSAVSRGQVRLAIDAPKEVNIDRAEIRELKVEAPRSAR